MLNGKPREALPERLVVLLRQNRRRHKHRHLLAVDSRLKRSSDGHLRLPITDIAAQQPIHRLRPLHILLDFLDRPQLVRRFVIRKHRFELLLVRRVLAEMRDPVADLAFCIQLNQLVGNILDGGARLALRPVPVGAAKLIYLRIFAFLGADIFLHEINLFNRHGQLIAAGIQNMQ